MYNEFHAIKSGDFMGHIACRPEPVDGWPGWVRAVVLNGSLQAIRGGKAQEIPEKCIGEARTAEQVAFRGKTQEQMHRELLSVTQQYRR